MAGKTYTGDTSNERIVGTNAVDYLNGAGGNDIIFGHAGRDVLIGGAGDDRIYAGGGRSDQIYTDDVDSALKSIDGNDRVYAGLYTQVYMGGGRDVVLDGGTALVSFELWDHGIVGSLKGWGIVAGSILKGVHRLFGTMFDDHLVADDSGDAIGGGWREGSPCRRCWQR